MMFFLEICNDLAPILRFIKKGIIPLIQIGIPIILILLGMIDLGKAVIASKEDEIKKAQGMLIKRIIYAVAVFFVVTIVMLVFGIFVSSNTEDGDTVSGTQSWIECWDDV